MDDIPFTIDKLEAAMRSIKRVPPPPMLASSKHFSAHKALTFKHEGRDYVGAHPDLWERFREVPEAAPRVSANFYMEVTIWDIDTHEGRRSEFFSAMSQAMGGPKV